jgi:bacillithiol system protein YtxJ
MSWIELHSNTQIEEIKKDSFNKPILIFKHSTRCGISSIVFSRFKKKSNSYFDQITFYYLDLLNRRNLSNEIAECFGVNHKSPQVLLIKNGEIKAHHSHYDILLSFSLEKII